MTFIFPCGVQNIMRHICRRQKNGDQHFKMLYILKILIMLGNDFSSANTFPKLNFPSPSKTEQNTKPEGILLCEQTPNSVVRSAAPCHRRTR